MGHKITRPRIEEETIADVDLSDTAGHIELTLASSFMRLTTTEARELAAALTARAAEADRMVVPA